MSKDVMLFPAPIVVQSPRWSLDGRRCGPAFVGVLPSDEAGEGTAVVVRAAYQLSAEQGLVYAVDQSEARRSAEEQDPSPWAANKERCDLALRGKAFAAKAQETIGVSLAVGPSFRRSFVVRGPAAIEAMPLDEAYVFDADGTHNVAVGAGQLAPFAAEKSAKLSPQERQQQMAELLRLIEAGALDFSSAATEGIEEQEAVSPSENDRQQPLQSGLRSWEQLVVADVPLGEACQWAKSGMRCALPQGDEMVELQGLSRGGEVLRFAVAPHRLLVVAEVGLETYDVVMRIDGLIFDSEKALWLVEWRGQVPADLFAHPDSRLIAHFADTEAVPSLFEIDARLSRGHFQRAATPPDQRAPVPGVGDVALQLARQRTLAGPVLPFLDFENYARMRAKLWRLAEGPRQAELQAAGLDNLAWLAEDRAWTERIRSARIDGDRSEYMFYTSTLSQFLAEGKSQA